jgi:virulence-associated protein VagC
MMKRSRPTIPAITVPVLMLILPSAITNAGEDDHLEPCQFRFSEYENRVESESRAAMPGKVEFWATVIPSFQPEWSVGVSLDKGRYVVTHVVFRQSLWGSSTVQSGPKIGSHDFAKPHVRTTARTAIMSPELHEALRSQWARSQAVRLPQEFRVQTDTVLVHREGVRVILEPPEEWPEGYVESFAGAPADFRRSHEGKAEKRAKLA